MMSQFRRILLYHFRSQIPGAVLILEPSTSLVGAQYHHLIAGSMLLYSHCVINVKNVFRECMSNCSITPHTPRLHVLRNKLMMQLQS